MSPRAAWRLERLGFDPVYDYVAGKADWLAAGLPTVRADTGERRALDGADLHPRTCSPGTPLRELPADRSTIVVNAEHVVLGRIDVRPAADDDRVAETAMRPGPTTVRAHQPLDPLLARMEQQGVAEVVVTTPEGRLLGVVRTS